MHALKNTDDQAKHGKCEKQRPKHGYENNHQAGNHEQPECKLTARGTFLELHVHQ